MRIPMPQGEFKSSQDRAVTARAPEALELYNQIIESKKKSRIMMNADELQWKTIEGGVKVANLIDFRLAFRTRLPIWPSPKSRHTRRPATDTYMAQPTSTLSRGEVSA